MLRKYTKGHRLEKKRSLLMEKYNNHFSFYIQCIWEILAFPMASSNPSMEMLPKFLSALLSYHCSYISTFQMCGYFQLPQLPSPVVSNIQNIISKISSTSYLRIFTNIIIILKLKILELKNRITIFDSFISVSASTVCH